MEAWVEGRMEGKKEGWTDIDKPPLPSLPEPQIYICSFLTHRNPFKPLNQWFSTRGNFAPKGHLAMSGDISDCHSFGGGALLLALTGLRPRYVTHL